MPTQTGQTRPTGDRATARALYPNKTTRVQGDITSEGVRASTAIRAHIAKRRGLTEARVSDADVIEYAMRCWSRPGEMKVTREDDKLRRVGAFIK